mmetsp:Transcript_14784/g.34669  ORF Transcript_14784/g.34669 Transcript_14784/m.34669 type:complete len:239 (+) Transcript_14784:1348-2064(+)
MPRLSSRAWPCSSRAPLARGTRSSPPPRSSPRALWTWTVLPRKDPPSSSSQSSRAAPQVPRCPLMARSSLVMAGCWASPPQRASSRLVPPCSVLARSPPTAPSCLSQRPTRLVALSPRRRSPLPMPRCSSCPTSARMVLWSPPLTSSSEVPSAPTVASSSLRSCSTRAVLPPRVASLAVAPASCWAASPLTTASSAVPLLPTAPSSPQAPWVPMVSRLVPSPPTACSSLVPTCSARAA